MLNFVVTERLSELNYTEQNIPGKIVKIFEICSGEILGALSEPNENS